MKNNKELQKALDSILNSSIMKNIEKSKEIPAEEKAAVKEYLGMITENLSKLLDLAQENLKTKQDWDIVNASIKNAFKSEEEE